MSNTKQLQKLELTWIGKGEEPKLEPRILLENPEYSYGDPNSENMLIHGDNLLALKALEQDYAGKVKCIYIDPPYNTGNAFEHYDDGVEHSIWLNLMSKRLACLHKLLSKNGIIAVQIDDQEMAYLQIVLDEIFGRNNRINTICVNMSNLSGVKMTAAINGKKFPKLKEYILIYAKDKDNYKLKIPRVTKEKWDNEYNIIVPEFTREMYDEYINNTDNEISRNIESLKVVSLNSYLSQNNIIDDDNTWKSKNAFRIFASKPNTSLLKIAKSLNFDNQIGIIKNVSGTIKLIKTDFNRNTKTARIELVSAETNGSTYLGDHWNDIVTTGGVGQEGGVFFPNGKKPEKLVSRIIESASNEGDIILDSFLGSGTTVAVAHKMRRKYIGIELGDQAYTHCYPRLKNIVSGNDQTGISKAVNWQGGGGFKFYTLAPSLLKQDKFGNWVISKEFNADMLAAAMAKQEGFKYQPDNKSYWKHGQSSEQDFIFTTTQFLTIETLDNIKDEMLPGETLLICCKSFQRECRGRYNNITIKKIPQMLLGRCEFGKEDYSLNIINIPIEIEEDDSKGNGEKMSVQAINDNNIQSDQPLLF